MHVRLLKKIGAQHFVGQVLSSNAVVRFFPTPALVAREGALCLVTNCIFDSGTKLVKCQAVSHDDVESDAAGPDIAATAPAAARTPALAGSKRTRACFSDDDEA